MAIAVEPEPRAARQLLPTKILAARDGSIFPPISNRAIPQAQSTAAHRDKFRKPRLPRKLRRASEGHAPRTEDRASSFARITRSGVLVVVVVRVDASQVFGDSIEH